MKIPWQSVAGWYHAVVLAALPWCAWWDAGWAPAVVAALVAGRLVSGRSDAAEPWSSGATAMVVLVFVVFRGDAREAGEQQAA